MLSILAGKILDNRFLRLIKQMLQAGSLEDLGISRHAFRRAPRRREHAPNARGNFCFEVTLGYRRMERGR